MTENGVRDYNADEMMTVAASRRLGNGAFRMQTDETLQLGKEKLHLQGLEIVAHVSYADVPALG